jgi:hypothetical protein
LFIVKPYRKQVKPYQPHTMIYTEMRDYIIREGDDYKNWFVGVTDDHIRSLFVNHRVYENDDSYIFRECPNSRAAENVKTSLQKLGCKAISGCWVNAQNIVYAYRRSHHTNP